jgi:hypothetical protein
MVLQQRDIHLAENLLDRVHHHVRPADEVLMLAERWWQMGLKTSAVIAWQRPSAPDLNGFRRSLIGQRFPDRARQPVAPRCGLRPDDGRGWSWARFTSHDTGVLDSDHDCWWCRGHRARDWMRNRFMDTSLLSAAFQVVVGGLLAFATGILIGSS